MTDVSPTSLGSTLLSTGDSEGAIGTQKRPTKWILTAYGCLALPLCLAEIPIILYLPAFYAEELKLGTVLVGVVFLIARLWDGMSDILVGWLSDNSTSSIGRRKPWILSGAPLLMLSTYFLCSPPKGASMSYLIVWLALFYTAYTSIKIPYLSLGTELASDYVERSRVTSFREAFTMLGNLLFVSAPLLLLPDGAPLREVLALITASLLSTVPLTAAALTIWVPDPPPTTKAESHLLRTLSSLLSDRILRRFVTARFLYAMEEGVTNSLLVFSLSVGLGLPNKLFWSVFILYIATLIAMPMTLRMCRYLEKSQILAFGVLTQALVYGTVLLVPQGNFWIISVLWVILGFANTAMLSIPSSVLADIVDHGELMSGERRSGAYVAFDNLIYKIGVAVGVGISFVLLAAVSYDPNATIHGVADERNIRLLGFGLPCLLSLSACSLYFFHPITKKVQKDTREKIELRHRLNLT